MAPQKVKMKLYKSARSFEVDKLLSNAYMPRVNEKRANMKSAL